jgi:hypothetical protein
MELGRPLHGTPRIALSRSVVLVPDFRRTLVRTAAPRHEAKITPSRTRRVPRCIWIPRRNAGVVDSNAWLLHITHKLKLHSAYCFGGEETATDPLGLVISSDFFTQSRAAGAPACPAWRKMRAKQRKIRHAKSAALFCLSKLHDRPGSNEQARTSGAEALQGIRSAGS